MVYYFIPALKRGATNCQRFTSCPAIYGGVKSKNLLGFSQIFTQQLETTIEPCLILELFRNNKLPRALARGKEKYKFWALAKLDNDLAKANKYSYTTTPR